MANWSIERGRKLGDTTDRYTVGRGRTQGDTTDRPDTGTLWGEEGDQETPQIGQTLVHCRERKKTRRHHRQVRHWYTVERGGRPGDTTDRSDTGRL